MSITYEIWDAQGTRDEDVALLVPGDDAVPDNWIYVQDLGIKLGRIQVFNNWSPYLVADPEHTVWLGLEYFCAEGDEFWRTSDEGLVRQAVGELRRMGVLSPDCTVLDSHVERVRKAYPA